jgi:predicted phage terminase large subunit-like protein
MGEASKENIVIKPQPGPQEMFLGSSADIAIFGGAAGGGKSWAILVEPLRHVHNPNFNCVIFRSTYKQIKDPGGLWDEACNLYTPLGAKPNQSNLKFTFESGATVTFSYLQHENDKYGWQGSQIVLIIFDELTHYSESMFFYMMSRNRTTSGVRPYIRATCNPDPDSFVCNMISWWIDQASGLPINDRAGVVRWFVRDGDNMVWGDTKEELEAKYEKLIPRSVTFIPALLSDNKVLMDKDPGYYASLLSLPTVERERLLSGNWKIKASKGDYFKRDKIEIVDVIPAKILKTVRYWDRASTEKTAINNPDWTRGVKMSKASDGLFYVEHLSSLRGTPRSVEQLILNTASQDGKNVEVCLEQDPGQAGKYEVSNYIRLLAGYNVRAYPAPKGKKVFAEDNAKIIRARAFSSQWEAGNVRLVRGSWNDEFLNEHESFPPQSSMQHDDIVDATNGAFSVIANKGTDIGNLNLNLHKTKGYI